MNDYVLIDFLSPYQIHLFFLAICIHYDINKLLSLPINQDISLWPANPESLEYWLSAQDHQFERPKTSMSSEKPKQCFCPHYLVLIWLQLVLPSAAPGPAFAACRLSLELTAREPGKPARSQAAGDGRTCRSNRKPNCSSPFLNKLSTVNPLKWKRSAELMNPPSGKKYRLPQSTGCSPATASSCRKPVVQGAKNKGKHHECFGKISRRRCPPRHLVYLVCCPARFNCRRSYRRAFGGDF